MSRIRVVCWILQVCHFDKQVCQEIRVDVAILVESANRPRFPLSIIHWHRFCSCTQGLIIYVLVAVDLAVEVLTLPLIPRINTQMIKYIFGRDVVKCARSDVAFIAIIMVITDRHLPVHALPYIDLTDHLGRIKCLHRERLLVTTRTVVVHGFIQFKKGRLLLLNGPFFEEIFLAFNWLIHIQLLVLLNGRW